VTAAPTVVTAVVYPTGAITVATARAAGVSLLARAVTTRQDVTRNPVRTAAHVPPREGSTPAPAHHAGRTTSDATSGRLVLVNPLQTKRAYRAQAAHMARPARRRASKGTRPPEHKPRPHVAASSTTSHQALGGAGLVHRAIQFGAQPSGGTTTLL
jgi:hypothetical protein